MTRRLDGPLSRRDFLRRSTILAGALAVGSVTNLAACGSAGEAPANAEVSTAGADDTGPVNWLCWSTHANPEVISAFEAETGIKVNVIPFEGNSDAMAKLQQGLDQYDIVQADAHWPVLYFERGFVEPLDFAEFSSAQTLLPQFRDFEPWRLPDGRMVEYPNTYSPQGIIYRKDRFPEPPSSWEALFDSQYDGRILWFNIPDYSIPIGAILLGYDDPFNLSPDELQAVIDKFKDGKQHVKAMVASSTDLLQAFKSDEVDIGLGVGWSIVYRAWKEADLDLGYVVPKEGTVGWVDGDALIKGAKHAGAAKRWMDFQHKPENVAKRALQSGYAGPNAEAIQILRDSGPDGQKIIEVNQIDTIDDWFPRMQLLKPPPDPSAWVQAWNEVKGA